jgi:hypothetical protein
MYHMAAQAAKLVITDTVITSPHENRAVVKGMNTFFSNVAPPISKNR